MSMIRLGVDIIYYVGKLNIVYWEECRDIDGE